ncbi:hypothetical protein QYF36_017566 [Acer negundo]|nr:hypothetical protein QYF36_017566 [Acer negundo]
MKKRILGVEDAEEEEINKCRSFSQLDLTELLIALAAGCIQVPGRKITNISCSKTVTICILCIAFSE